MRDHILHSMWFIATSLIWDIRSGMSGILRTPGISKRKEEQAEDKIAKKAVLEKLEPMELVHKYTNLFHWAMQEFNTISPSIEPTATGHIVEQIGMIEELIQCRLCL